MINLIKKWFNKPPYHVFLICKWFILKYKLKNEYIDQMRLQRLVFIANGIHLAKYNKPLVSGKYFHKIDFIYHKEITNCFVYYGSNKIKNLNITTEPKNLRKNIDYPQSVLSILEKVYELTENMATENLYIFTKDFLLRYGGDYIPNDEIKDLFKHVVYD